MFNTLESDNLDDQLKKLKEELLILQKNSKNQDDKLNDNVNELDSLKITGDFFKKIIIRNDISKTFYDDFGIMHVSLLSFLLGDVELF